MMEKMCSEWLENEMIEIAERELKMGIRMKHIRTTLT
jgi:hypothetical protein